MKTQNLCRVELGVETEMMTTNNSTYMGYKSIGEGFYVTGSTLEEAYEKAQCFVSQSYNERVTVINMEVLDTILVS